MDIKKWMRLLIEKYRSFIHLACEMHKHALGVQGHGLDHDLMVAGYCLLITEDQRTGELAWLAAFMHSIDRNCKNPVNAFNIMIHILEEEDMADYELKMIIDAAKNHFKPNSATDSAVLVTLKDADRLANIGPLNLIRCGQHRKDLPAITLGVFDLHPQSTFKSPKSALDCIFYNLEWEDMLRLPKAKKLAKKYFDYYRKFLELNRIQFAEVGLDIWPPE